MKGEIDAMAKHYAAMQFEGRIQSFNPALARTGKKIHDKYCEKCHEDGGRSQEDDAGLLVGQWKAGGLLNLTYEPPSPAVEVAIDLVVKIVALLVIHLVWQRTQAKRALETTDA